MAILESQVAKKQLNGVVIQLRNDTAANWQTSTYILKQGELGLDRTNNVIKIGDGTNLFKDLPNAGAVIEAASAYDAVNNPGGKDAEHGGIKVNGVDLNVYELLAASTEALGGIKSAGDAASVTDDAAAIGQIYVNTTTGAAKVSYVKYADQLKTARTVEFGESTANAKDTDATGSFSFDGSADVKAQLTLVDKVTFTSDEETAGFKRVVVSQVDKKGRVIGAENLVSADVSDAIAATTGTSDASKVIKTGVDGLLNDSFLQTVTRVDAAVDNTATTVITSVGSDGKGRINATGSMQAVDTSAGATDTGKLVKLDGAGKIDASMIPALAIGEVFTTQYAASETVGENDIVAFRKKSEAAGAAAAATSFEGRAESGDILIVSTTKSSSETDAQYNARKATNGDGVYIYQGNTTGTEAYNASNWVLVKTPGSAIQAVNGQTGPNVVLTTSNIDEGTNLYFTEQRVYDAIHSISARDSVKSFSDAEHIVLDTDSFVINCGTAAGETVGA